MEREVVLEDICKVRVKFNEIDSMKRVWHGSYIIYFEDGRESFGRQYAGIGYEDIVRSGIYAPIVDVRIKYYGPLSLNDVAVIKTRYVYKRGARLDYSYEVSRESDGKICAAGSTTQLFIDENEQLLLDPPQYYLDWQKKYGIIE